jgi:hypothetical protein
MAYYDALIAKWAQAPAGTTQQKMDWINAQTVIGDPIPMRVANFEIYNRTDRAEYESLATTKQTPIQRNLAVEIVDFSIGSAARGLWNSTFPPGGSPPTSKTQQNLAPYIAQFDTPPIPWPTAPLEKNGGGLRAMVAESDLKAAGII